MPNAHRVSETNVADAVLSYLAQHRKGEASIAELIKALPGYLQLSESDRITSKTRPNEEIWEQQVRNITSHHNIPGNFINEGYLEKVKGGLRITEIGKRRVEHRKS